MARRSGELSRCSGLTESHSLPGTLSSRSRQQSGSVWAFSGESSFERSGEQQAAGCKLNPVPLSSASCAPVSAEHKRAGTSIFLPPPSSSSSDRESSCRSVSVASSSDSFEGARPNWAPATSEAQLSSPEPRRQIRAKLQTGSAPNLYQWRRPAPAGLLPCTLACPSVDHMTLQHALMCWAALQPSLQPDGACQS